MAVAPRAVVITRPTEYDVLLGRHGTRAAVGFFLEQRGQTMDLVDERHTLQKRAIHEVANAIPMDWRRASVTRDDLDRWMFGPEDVVIAVGQDGLVANVAKYLDGQPVIGVNPNPERNPGVLVRYPSSAVKQLLADLIGEQSTTEVEARTMVDVSTDDGQHLRALNEVFIGDVSHQSARYEISLEGQTEHQSSSGLLVGTGTGATGWCRSIWNERQLDWPLPNPNSRRLSWFVREAWPSPHTGCQLTAGLLDEGTKLVIVCESDRMVAFGDGIESDRIDLRWGQKLTVTQADRVLHLV